MPRATQASGRGVQAELLWESWEAAGKPAREAEFISELQDARYLCSHPRGKGLEIKPQLKFTKNTLYKNCRGLGGGSVVEHLPGMPRL